MIPLVLILITAGVLLWIVLPLVRGGAAVPEVGPDESADLVARREQLLFALQDLDFELETGKLSAEDHAELRARVEADAVEVMKHLERAGTPPPGADAD